MSSYRMTCAAATWKTQGRRDIGLEAEKLLKRSIGWDDEVNETKPQKSLSQARTFRATTNVSELEATLTELCGQLSAAMEREKVTAATLTFTYQPVDSADKSKTVSGKCYRTATDLTKAAMPLLRAIGQKIRKMSVGVSKLTPRPKRTLDAFLVGAS
jgi:hypothetical protein